ncbi:hypothetical protein K9L16_01295 [Candidatus Pacearchaeota archaeon]|nr:hypothetical protein [Candidatus Pacearchaeota archaeon]
MKILCLGNEFVKEDSLAKKIGFELKNLGFDILNIKDSFQLMSVLNNSNKEEVILLDVVQDLDNVGFIEIKDLRNDSIISAHDFDAGYVLKLINKSFKIIGIPQKGNLEEIKNKVIYFLRSIKAS